MKKEMVMRVLAMGLVLMWLIFGGIDNGVRTLRAALGRFTNLN